MSKILCLGGCGKSYDRKDIHLMQAGKAIECHACHKKNVLARAKSHQQWKEAGRRARVADEHNNVVETVRNMFNDTSKLPKKKAENSMLRVDAVLFDLQCKRELREYD